MPVGPGQSCNFEDGTQFTGTGFGRAIPAAGEVVFNTGMVGYGESLTDPSYRGQILVMTYPLVGNYGVPPKADRERFESDRIQVAGLVVATAVEDTSHMGAARSLPEWLAEEGVPGVEGVDTRSLTLRLRERGTMLGRILQEGMESVPMFDPNRVDIVSEVCIKEPVMLGRGKKRVILVDCGVKRSIVNELVSRGLEVLQVPAGWDFTGEAFDGVLVSNGPGNPEQCPRTVAILRRALALGRPVFGICMGCLLLGLAAGGRTYKLRYGHRDHNQPCLEEGTNRCRLTSQNHGYAVDAQSLSEEWEVWFTNANDGSVEGIRHRRRPFWAVQFHPEASPGPLDCRDLFDQFVALL
ncbi:MAG: glutamine-hydrolyzing carbamoyl-phosphate synthase small subunit [candidate division WOR-3 bacterium]